MVAREGTMEFWHVPVDGSAEMDDSTTESIEPFDYRALTEFNPAYLAGYQTVTVKRRNLSSHGGKAHYALLPVWLFETVYRDKKYQFAINGQTGKMVGELPVDRGAFWRYLCGFTAVGTAVCSGIMKRHGSRKLRQCSDACGQYGRTRLGTGGIRNGTGSIFRIWTGADQGTDIRRSEAVAKADHKSVVLQQPFPVL